MNLNESYPIWEIFRADQRVHLKLLTQVQLCQLRPCPWHPVSRMKHFENENDFPRSTISSHTYCPTAIYDSITWLRQSEIRSHRPIYTPRLGLKPVYLRYLNNHSLHKKPKYFSLRKEYFFSIVEGCIICIICTYYSLRGNIGWRPGPNYRKSGSETEHNWQGWQNMQGQS